MKLRKTLLILLCMSIMTVPLSICGESDPVKKTFIYEDADVYREVVVENLDKKEISFVLLIRNKKKNSNVRLTGRASLKSGDFEIDTDSEGNGYPVKEYVYDQDKRYIAFRIDVEKQERMTVKSPDAEICSEQVLKSR